MFYRFNSRSEIFFYTGTPSHLIFLNFQAPGLEYSIGGNPKYDSFWNTLLGRKPYSRRVLTFVSGTE